jgi:hypothetical protein
MVFTVGSSLNLPSQYDDFLFAALCYSPGGGSVTVLSALARMNIDPWEEAARLSKLARPDAVQSLALTLNGTSEYPQESLETQSIATRLVSLLPETPSASMMAPHDVNKNRIVRTDFWLVWLCIQILLFTLVSFRGHSMVQGPSDAASSSGASESPRDKSLASERSVATSGRTAQYDASSSAALPPTPNEH